MVVRKRKYESGAATAYISRNQAIRKLQLKLADFRRLCILKGIHPHEPRHPKKVGKGSTQPKTYYLKKDIQFMAQEPIINKFRDFRSYVKRLKKAVHKGDRDKAKRSRNNKPRYELDHIVKERYPRFEDALRDLDDCLSLCFLFATFQKSKNSSTGFIQTCRKRTVEFMHYVMASRSLRKVFISIKGIYYQADIQGETVTWIVQHKRGFTPATDVDFRIMSTFIEFYTLTLGFVNQRLYTLLGLHYPPQLKLDQEDDDSDMCLPSERLEERLAALTQKLHSSRPEDEDVDLDEFPVDESGDPESIEKAKAEAAEVKRLRHLFDGLKFFLNRETPKESLTLVIRSFGGAVSWDRRDGLGATYGENDNSITHQIVDRNHVAERYLSRLYVQPQWVYDCVNARRLLPNSAYAPGAALPPHLSPFSSNEEDSYQPPEASGVLALSQTKGAETGDQEMDEESNSAEDEEKGEEEDEDEEEDDKESGTEEEELEAGGSSKRLKQEDVAVGEEPFKKRKKAMTVTAGCPERKEKAAQAAEDELRENMKLREMMVPKKKRRLYNKIKYKQKKIRQEKEKLTEKRRQYDEHQRKQKAVAQSQHAPSATPSQKTRTSSKKVKSQRRQDSAGKQKQS